MSQASFPEPEITIIVPTLNEAGNIGRLLDAVADLEPLKRRYEVIVADDSSTDGTVEEVRLRMSSQPVQLLQRQGVRDLTASVLEAARLARGEWVVVMDADGSHPVDVIPDLLAPLRKGLADLSLGSRHVHGGGIDNWPRWRRWVSRVASLLAWPFTGVSDPMSGLFATRRERLLELPVEYVGYKILLELLLRTTPEPRVTEVPFIFTDRAAGQSKMTGAVQRLFMRRLAFFAGAQPYTGKTRAILIALIVFAVFDTALFAFLHAQSISLNLAQLLSFMASALLLFGLFVGWLGAARVSRRHFVSRFLLASSLIFVLNGGLFGLLLPFGPLIASALVSLFSATLFLPALVFYVFPNADSSIRPIIRWHLTALALIAISLLLRLLYLGQAELIFDEMYYWTYTLYPALSYLDHPPLTAWLIAIGTTIAGDTAFGVRWMHLVLAPLALVLAYAYGKAMSVGNSANTASVGRMRVGKTISGRTVGLMSALLVAIVPAWFASGFLMVTDAPQLVAWLAALYGFQRVLIENRADGWVIAALGMGLGLLSKYTIAFLAPAVLIFMLLHPPARRWLWNWRTWLAGFVALLLFSPVLIWNLQNDWASFAFQTTRRIDEQASFSSHWLIAHTLIMLAPLAGIAALYVLGPVRRRLVADRTRRVFMLTMTLTPLAFLAFFGALTPTKFHWVMPIWLGLLPMIAATIVITQPPRQRSESAEPADTASMNPNQADHPGRMLRFLGRSWPVVLPATLIAFGLGLQHATSGLPGVPIKEHRLGYLGWPEIAKAVHELEIQVEQSAGQRPIVAGMAKWGVSAALSFHDADGRSDNITARNLVGLGGSQWERWFDHTQSPDRPVILVHHEAKLIDEDWLELALVGLGPLQMKVIERDGRPIQRLYYRIGDGFRPEMLRYPGHIPD